MKKRPCRDAFFISGRCVFPLLHRPPRCRPRWVCRPDRGLGIGPTIKRLKLAARGFRGHKPALSLAKSATYDRSVWGYRGTHRAILCGGIEADTAPTGAECAGIEAHRSARFSLEAHSANGENYGRFRRVDSAGIEAHSVDFVWRYRGRQAEEEGRVWRYRGRDFRCGTPSVGVWSHTPKKISEGTRR